MARAQVQWLNWLNSLWNRISKATFHLLDSRESRNWVVMPFHILLPSFSASRSRLPEGFWWTMIPSTTYDPVQSSCCAAWVFFILLLLLIHAGFFSFLLCTHAIKNWALVIPVMCLADGVWRSWRVQMSLCHCWILFLSERPWCVVQRWVCPCLCLPLVAHKNLTAHIIQGAARVCCLQCLISLSVCLSSAMGVGGWDLIPQFIHSSLHLQQSSLMFSLFPGSYCELILLLTSCMRVSWVRWITWNVLKYTFTNKWFIE